MSGVGDLPCFPAVYLVSRGQTAFFLFHLVGEKGSGPVRIPALVLKIPVVAGINSKHAYYNQYKHYKIVVYLFVTE